MNDTVEDHEDSEDDGDAGETSSNCTFYFSRNEPWFANEQISESRFRNWLRCLQLDPLSLIEVEICKECYPNMDEARDRIKDYRDRPGQSW